MKYQEGVYNMELSTHTVVAIIDYGVPKGTPDYRIIF